MVNRIERPRTRVCVFLLGVLFLVAFIVLLGIGDGAPKVLLVTPSDEDRLTYRPSNENFYQTDFELSRENQLFWVDLRLGTENLEDLPLLLEVDLDIAVSSKSVAVATYKVTAMPYCRDDGVDYCDYFFLFKRDFVDHAYYSLAVTFLDPDEYLVNNQDGRDHDGPLFKVQSQVISVNPEFTRFEIAFKYLWLVTTLLVIFCPCGVGFRSALKRHQRDTGVRKTFHQKWTSVLLWALVWFDDPFVAATVYTDWAKVFSACFILSVSIFVFLILLFWLCFLSDLRFMQGGGFMHVNARRGCCYWIPKLILTLAIGATVLGGYMYYRFENSISFEYTGVEDEKEAAESLAVLLGLLLSVYLLWTTVLGLRSCGGLRKVSPSYILLYVITLLVSLVAVVGVFVAAYYPYSTSGVAFVGIHGLLNLYVWTLAISFSPVRSPTPADKAVSLGGNAAVTGTAASGGTDRKNNDDIPGWEKPADSDFKAVEL